MLRPFTIYGEGTVMISRLICLALVLPWLSACSTIDAFLFDMDESVQKPKAASTEKTAAPIEPSVYYEQDKTEVSEPEAAQSATHSDTESGMATPPAEEGATGERAQDEATASAAPDASADQDTDKEAKAEEVRPAVPKDATWVVISFKPGQTHVEKDTRKTLRKLAAQFLMVPRPQTIEVRGYCDAEPIGGYAKRKHRPRHHYKSQEALSLARAQAVADVLIKAGIPQDIVTAKGFGATHFIASNDTAAGRDKNRRVEIHLLAKEQ